jgi:hypothetical protein
MLSPCQLVYFAHTSHFISIGATLRALRNFLEQQNSIPNTGRAGAWSKHCLFPQKDSMIPDLMVG